MSVIENVGMKELLEAGVHFGHKSVGWNPNMKKYIFMKKKGVHVIDLQKTLVCLEQTYNYVKNVVASGGDVLFVGTKKQAKAVVKEAAKACGQHYITQRWVGGLLTNFEQIRRSIKKIEEYEAILEDGVQSKEYSKKELIQIEKKALRLKNTFEGIRGMTRLPDLVFVVDALQEGVALMEAKCMKILTAGVVDTNSDPSLVDQVIPGNDDAVRSLTLLVGHIAHAVIEGLRFRNIEVEAVSESKNKDDEASNGSRNSAEDQNATAEYDLDGYQSQDDESAAIERGKSRV